MTVQPYLFFGGRCAEAIEFYRNAVGADVAMALRFKDAPDKSMVTPENENLVMHAAVNIDGAIILMADGMTAAPTKFEGFALSIYAKDGGEFDKYFGALSNGGAVFMPPGETFFADKFGVTKDKFGVQWMVIIPKPMG